MTEMSELPEIPPGQYKYKPYPIFAKWPKGPEGTWHVFGPVDILNIGSVLAVFRYADETAPEYVEILGHVATRDVKKRDGEQVQYVMAIFDNCIEEGEAQ